MKKILSIQVTNTIITFFFYSERRSNLIWICLFSGDAIVCVYRINGCTFITLVKALFRDVYGSICSIG